MPQAVALTSADLIVLGDGVVNVTSTAKDAAGNVSPAAVAASFTLDTAIAAPVVALAVDSGVAGDLITNNSTLSVSGVEPGALVEYSIDGGVTWTAAFTAVEGANTVSVRQTDLAGNVSPATVFDFVLDTVVPVAPLVSTLSGDMVVDNTEAGVATQLNIALSGAGETVQSVTVNGMDILGSPSTVNGYQTTNGNWVFDATQFADGNLMIQTNITDAAGNARLDTFALTKSTVANPAHVDAGGDAFVNQWETSPWTTLNVVPTAGDAINSVTISGVDALGNAISAVATWNGFSYGFDAAQFADGPLTVTVNVTGVSGTAVDAAPVTLTKDTVIGGVASVNVGGDAFIDATEVSTTTALNLARLDAGDMVQSVQVTGLAPGGWWNWVNATQDAAGNWVFDATQFMDGNLTVYACTTDVAGNVRWDAFALTKSTVAVGTVRADVGGDAFVNQWEASPWTTLNVIQAAGDTINSVTISGMDALGNAISTVATLNGASYTFDSTLFAEGVLTVTVNVTGVSGTAVDVAPVTLTKDTVIGGVANVNVGGDAFIDATEVSTATVLNLAKIDASDTVQSVQVTGLGAGGWWNWVNATQDAAGNWVFDATQFVDGNLTVQAYTTDAAGNSRWDSFTVTKSSVAAGTVHADVGGDAFINQWETGSWTQLNVVQAAGDTINSVTISGVDALGNAVSAMAIWTGVYYAFDSTLFAEGVLTVTVNVTGVSGTGVDVAPVTLTKDTLIGGVANINVGGDAFIDATEVSTATVLNLVSAGGAGETVQSVQVTGLGAGGWWNWASATQDAAGNWVFDATQFVDGLLTVQSTVVDTAGNTATSSFNLIKNMLPLGAALVDVGGDTYINQQEAGWTTLNVLPAAGDTINSVTVCGVDVNGNAFSTQGYLSGGSSYNFWGGDFADGPLTVLLNATSGTTGSTYQAVATLTKDTFIGGVASVNVGGDAFIGANETTTATPLSFAVSAGETVQSVQVCGQNGAGWWQWNNAVQDANGNWVFDATQFVNGSLTVQTTTVDPVGNAVTNSFELTKNSINVAAGAVQVDAGGDAFINQAETGWPGVQLHVQTAAGDAINSVTISGTDALGNAVSTVATWNGAAYTFDSTLFADGALTVTVNVTGVSGTAVDAVPVTLTKDTVIGGVASVNVGGDIFIDATEVSAATVLNLAKIDAGDTIQQVQVTGLATGGWWSSASATQDAAGNWVFDAAQFADGNLTVQTNTMDAAGNTRLDSYILTKSTLAAGTVHADVGGDAFVNQWESNPWTTLNVIQAAGDMINSLTIGGTDALGNAVSTVATWNGTNYTFDSTLFTDGALTVTVNVTGVSGTSVDVAPVALTKDTLIGVTNVTVGGDAFIDATEVSTATVLNLAMIDSAHDTIQQVQVSGLATGGWWSWASAMQDAAGNWVFDATQFADGNLTVRAYTTDAASNARWDFFTLTKSTVAAGTVHADVGGDAFVNQWESSPWTTLHVIPAAGDAINSVTISGTDALGNAVSTVATWNGTNYMFDSTLFADGTLTVTANVTGVSGTAVDAAPVTLTKDTLIGVANVTVGGDAVIDATEVSAATVLNLAMVDGARDTIQQVQVSGLVAGGWLNWVNATQDAAGNWVFDATQFVDGNLSVSTYTTDAAGNARWDYFTLTKSTVAAGTVHADVGGDAFINQWEAAWTMLNVIQAAGDTINSVTIGGTDALGNAVSAVASWNGTNYRFDATLFADGVLTVTVNVTGVSGTAVDVTPVSLTKDTVIGGIASVNVGGDAFIDATEISTATILNLVPGGGVGETVQSVQVSGLDTGGWWTWVNATQDAASNWVFDATLFADGNLSVQTNTTDVAGNARGDSFAVTKSTLAAGTAHADVGGDAFISQWETGSWTSLNVIPAAGDTINSVTISGMDALGNAFSTAATLNGTYYTFDSTLFAEGALTVTVNVTGVSGTAVDVAPVRLTKDTLVGGVASVNVGGDVLIDMTEVSTATALNLTQIDAGETVQAVQVTGQGTGGWWNWVNATQDVAGNWVFDATQFADGNLTVQTYTTDAAGNYRPEAFTLTKATMNAVTYTQGGATTVSVSDMVYQDISTAAAPLNDTYTVMAANNTTVLTGEGADTVILADAAANTLFTRLDGGAGAADVLQLSANYGNIDFSMFNHAAQPVIQGFEVIDLATDAGADMITLTAADLFNMGSHLVDASTGAQTIVVTGDSLDTANILAGGFVQQAGVFDTTGAANATGGFNKHVATYADMNGAHLVELLMQNSVIIV